MQVFAVVVALCAIGALACRFVLRDGDHWRDGDPRHASRGALRGALVALAAAGIVIGICICGAVSAHARPSPYPPVTQFNGDRYGAQAQMGADVVRAVKAKTGAKARRHQRHYRKPAPGYIAGRPAAWCGWWLGHHLGMPLRHLWKASNWASVGSSAGGPRIGAIVVWRHHVGIITGRHGNQWVVKSGNDGGRVRERPRSVSAAIAFRSPS